MKPSFTVLAVLFVLLSHAARAEVELTFALAKAAVEDTDLELSRPGDTHLTYSSVRWRDESFKMPLYLSLRTTWWRRSWGVGLDYTHAKAIAETGRVAPVQGRRAGAPAAGRERIADTLPHFEMSHGLNTATVNLLRRWSSGRLQPYAGLGAGVAVPHVEAVIGDNRTDGYQWAGPAFEGRLGLALRLRRHLSAIAEYKLTYARVSADLAGGGSVEVAPRLHQLIVGFNVNR